ncbi:Nicalin-1 [Orchesella cincta]|uniref:BOS complex subunit NCLN n=1 Tax=Orchesella cincta TaxID=48709 RepID=A0A1D2MX52_ORCCI|nr:Nicalin-1 [Orchesella cincta]
MWFDQGNELFDVCRTSFFAYLLLALPIFVSISPTCLASKEFSAFRLQQFELHGSSYGTSGSLLNLETRILPGSPMVSSPRRCYVVRLVDLTVNMYKDLLTAQVAGIVIIVPADLSSISGEIRDQIQELEQAMLADFTTVPVYFIQETQEVNQVYQTIKESAESLGAASTALQTLFHHVHGNGVQLVSSLGSPKVMSDAQILSIQGALIGTKSSRSFPILISTHYDSMSPAAELSFGGDANGSGAVSLLELARVFSHLYSTRGTQKYLEDQVDSSDQSDLQDTRLVVCLDSLTTNPDKLFVHVSRSIREGTMLNTFINNLKKAAIHLEPSLTVEVIQRKIRTENLLSWEHEKFHLKKINAITISSSESPSLVKSSMLDVKDNVDTENLAAKTRIVAEALAASLYNVTEVGTAFSGSLGVSDESVNSLLEFVTSQPRSAQLLAGKQNKFVQSLRNVLARYTHETSLFTMKPDKRDANLVFYDGTSGTIVAYDVKPAVFDLVLSLAIAAYIGAVYLAIKNFSLIYDSLSYKLSSSNHHTSSTTNGTSGSHTSKVKAQ